MGAGVVTAPVRQAAESVVPVIAESVKSVVNDLAGRERDRRCWQGGDRYWIEVRGLDGSPRGIDLGHRVRDAVRAQPGIISADLNYSLSRIVVRVGPDAPAIQGLRDVVASQESAGKPSGPRVDLPADNPALASSVVGATLNAAGLGVALAGQVLRLPRWPAGATAVVSLVDYQPRLRRLVEQ